MVNETLCKVLCHNLIVLIHEMYELEIDPVFWVASVDYWVCEAILLLHRYEVHISQTAQIHFCED
jgi:hypothetical protein